MDEYPRDPHPKPTAWLLITKGLLMIFGAFVAAVMILMTHAPLGH